MKVLPCEFIDTLPASTHVLEWTFAVCIHCCTRILPATLSRLLLAKDEQLLVASTDAMDTWLLADSTLNSSAIEPLRSTLTGTTVL